MPDIDIDFANRDQILTKIKHVPARLQNRKHNTGVYTHRVPVDPFKGLCTLDHKAADEAGYFKLDMLNVSIYKDVRDENHLQELMDREPIWELLQHEDFADQVFHVSGHSDLMRKLKPSNISELAATLAIIRPSKRYLESANWDRIHKEVWVQPTNDQYYFKKAHAFSYAMAVVVHMNLICEKLGY